MRANGDKPMGKQDHNSNGGDHSHSRSPAGSMLLAKVRIMEIDHDPDGYPAITMREVSALANYLEVEMWRADAAEQEVYRLRQILSNAEVDDE